MRLADGRGLYETSLPRSRKTNQMSRRSDGWGAAEDLERTSMSSGGISMEVDVDLLRLASLGGGESRSSQYTGTKALMLAVLEDGIRSYLSPVARIRSEAEYWISTTR